MGTAYGNLSYGIELEFDMRHRARNILTIYHTEFMDYPKMIHEIGTKYSSPEMITQLLKD
jgi:hypothetical protein